MKDNIYKEIGKIFTKDAEYKYRGYILSKRGGSSSATAVATEELIKKAEEKGLKIKTRLIGPRNFPIKDMKNMVDRELLAAGLNQEFTKDASAEELAKEIIDTIEDDYRSINNKHLSQTQINRVKKLVKEEEKKQGENFKKLIHMVGYKKANSMVQGYAHSVIKNYGKGLENFEIK